MWYICFDKVTDEVRRVMELSTQAKADAITKYRMSDPMVKRPDVEIVPEPIVAVVKTEKERILEVLGITLEDISQIKKIASIEQSVVELKADKPVEEKP